MGMSSLEEHLGANADDILEFLEIQARYIRPIQQKPEQPGAIGKTIHFCGERKGNTISINTESCESDGHEIIRFEIIQQAETLAVVKASYESNNSRVALIFYRIWTSLAIAFGGGFAGEALKQLRQLERTVL